jgi:DNA-nicking Smr family endonuclease
VSKPPSKPRRRHLSKEDEALWEHTASSLQPLKVRKDRHLADMPDLDSITPFLTDGKAAKSGPAKSDSKPLPTPPRTSDSNAPSLSTFDRKAARKLRQGHFEIEARIDLHGMRQHEAHVALRGFLHSAFRKGQRWVLVITGKGGPRRPRDDDDMFGVAERGVLKKNVPMWLAEPELRAIVVSFTSAAISHGGEGALYVQLRNPEKVR